MHYKDRSDLETQIMQLLAVQRLQSFTKGFYRVDLDSEGVVLSDLRMGVEPDYVFVFRIADNGNPHPRLIVPQRIKTKRDYGRLEELWERMLISLCITPHGRSETDWTPCVPQRTDSTASAIQ